MAPALKKCHTAIELYRLLNDTNDLRKAREALLNYIGNISFVSYFNPHYSNLFLLGIKDYQHGLVELHDDFVSREVRYNNFSK